jgi:undecaprenyl-diphosphatase
MMDIQHKSSLILARLRGYDAALCVSMNRFNRRRAVQLFFGAVSRLGNGVFWYTLMALLLITEPAALKPVAHMVAVGVVGLLIYKWLKNKTLRPRPCELHTAITRSTEPLDEFSFPSGHTLHAVAFTVVAITYFPWLAPLLIPFAMLVAASRIVLGLHYPTDVLAGGAIGYSLAALSFLL